MEKLLINNLLIDLLRKEITFFFLVFLFLFSCKTIPPPSTNPTKNPPKETLAQKPNANYTLVETIDEKGKKLTTDKLQNAYLVTNENELIKYSKEGKELYTYANFELGEITHLDANNPFNILLYYSEFQTVVILDRTLSPINIFDLYESNTPVIKAIGLADDQNVWLYDELNYRLKKINRQGEIIFESSDLSQNIDKKFSPSFLLESGGEVFLLEENSSLFIFDNFARFLRQGEFKIPNGRMQSVDGLYVFLQADGLHIINPFLGSEEESILVLPKESKAVINAEIQQKRLFLLEKDKFSIYTFEKM